MRKTLKRRKFDLAFFAYLAVEKFPLNPLAHLAKLLIALIKQLFCIEF